jgi:restriction system protein
VFDLRVLVSRFGGLDAVSRSKSLAIPPFNWFFRRILATLAEHGTMRTREFRDLIAAQSGLSVAELTERIPSGQFTVFESRTGWARTYLFKAGLIERVSRGTYRLTDAGRHALREYPEQITISDLCKDPEFKAWHTRKPLDDEGPGPTGGTVEGDELPPMETMMSQMVRSEVGMRTLVEEDLRERLASMSPSRFEWLVEQLVVRLGYGSSDAEVHMALSSGSGDNGVDGVIKEDRLGLGQIYLQAKRWKGNVSRPEIQSFVGAMHGRAQKGVFITTSGFTDEAIAYARSLHGIRLRLVDGAELASLMIDCSLGVNEERVYRTYRIDGDFFEDGE